MAFNFSPGGIYQPKPIDFSSLADLPEDFWKGQAVGRQNQLRSVLGTDEAKAALASGDYGKIASLVSQYDPALGEKYGAGTSLSGAFGTPIFGVTQDTKQPVVGQLTRNGQLLWHGANGESVDASKGVQYLNQGTQFTPTDRLTGQPTPGVAPVPINNAEKQRQEEAGVGQGKAQVNLPSAENAASRMFRQLDGLSNDPYLPSMTGYKNYLPNVSPESKRITSKVQQITAGTFLQQYETLRGAGQISDAEGARADAAISRLQQLGVDDAGYKAALADVKSEIANLLQVAKAKASGVHEMPATNPGELPVYDSPQGGNDNSDPLGIR